MVCVMHQRTGTMLTTRRARPCGKGEASAQTHAYLLMSFAIFSLPAALLLVYVYGQLSASKARGCRD